MNNRAIKKLLSVALVMAICISTVFTCLITVNAADSVATYTVTAETLYAYADEGKATLTFDLESGFTGGSFTLLKDNASFSVNYDKEGNLILPAPWNSEYGDVEIKVVGGTTADGTLLTADQMDVSIFNDTNNNGKNDAEEEGDVKSSNNALWFDADGNYKDAEGNNYAFVPDVTDTRWETYRLSNISFDSGDVVYKSLTLEFTFEWDYCMQPNSKNEIIFAQEGQTDHLGNEYAAPVLKNGETSYVLSENVVEGNINYFHSHSAKNIDTATQLLQKNDYSIY